jgi:hypothetical protein
MVQRIRLVVAATLLLGFLIAADARTSRAADAPTHGTAPAPAPSLAVSDRAPQGCCCISTNEPGKQPGCQYGLSEAVCAKAGKAVATWSSSWTVGKCPLP